MKKIFGLMLALVVSTGFAQAQEDVEFRLHEPSFSLGIIAGFSEVVNAGVKKLALSEPLPPKEMDEIMAEAEKIVKRNDVMLYRESDLIVTDLFPSNVAKGKDVLLIYNGNTLNEYLALKEELALLIKRGEYSGEKRKQIARRFGILLSYTPAYIDRLIKKTSGGK